MSARPLRIATTKQLMASVRAAGYETYLLPEEVDVDFNRALQKRLADGPIYERFLEKNNIDLVLDFNTGALTFLQGESGAGHVTLTTAARGIPHVACYVDPITSTMSEVSWQDHWHLLENSSWIKGISDTAHAEELVKLNIPAVVSVPMALADEDKTFDLTPNPEPDPGPVIAFMGHPASSWFASQSPTLPCHLFAGFTAAATRSEMEGVPFHATYYDLYNMAEPIKESDDPATRSRKSKAYFDAKFTYNAFLAVKQRDRWVRFLQAKLGDQFELIGDHWDKCYGLKHSPRIWDRGELYRRMRHVPICLNLIKGNIESSVIMRHFEITACGGFMLTYPTPELGSFFEIGKECEVFTSESDLLEKIAFYLAHPQKRWEIAAAGQRRTFRDHLYSKRITDVVEKLKGAGLLPTDAGSKRNCDVTPPMTASSEDCTFKPGAEETIPEPKINLINYE